MSACNPDSHPCKAIPAAFAVADAAAAPKKRNREIEAGRADEIPLGGRKIVEIDHLSIGIFHLRDGFHAVRNQCPHQGAELCKGSIHGTHRPSDVGEFEPALDGRVLRCPWHGWEFDIVTGKGLYNEKDRVLAYEVRVHDDGRLTVLI